MSEYRSVEGFERILWSEGFERILWSAYLGIVAGFVCFCSSFMAGWWLPRLLPKLKDIDFASRDYVLTRDRNGSRHIYDIPCRNLHKILRDVYPSSDDLVASTTTHALMMGGVAWIFFYFKFNQKLIHYLQLKADLAIFLFVCAPAAAACTYRYLVLIHRALTWQSYRRQLRVQICLVYPRWREEQPIFIVNTKLSLWYCLEEYLENRAKPGVFPPMNSSWFYLEGERVAEQQLKHQSLKATLSQLKISANNGTILNLSMEDARVYTFLSVSKLPSRDLNKYLLKFLRD